MSDIRVTYTGLITFTLKIVTVFVSLAFLLIITRALSVEEYGTWGLINNMLTYVILAEVLPGYWVSREIARKTESGKTAIMASGALSAGGVGAYVIVVLAVGGSVDLDTNAILLAAMLVPARYINVTLTKINRSWRPHTTSYALIVQALMHIPLAIFFVYYMNWGVVGVILSVFVALITCNLMLVTYVREKLRSEFNLAYVRKWFRLSWVSLYPTFAAMIFRLDVIILALVSGSVTIIALWVASFTLTSVVIHSAAIGTALYPKLLEGGGTGHVQKNIPLFFFISIPLTATIVSLAEPILFILGPEYEKAYLGMSILSIGMLFTAMTSIFQPILEGNERVDSVEKASVADFVRSRLFLVPTINVAQYGSYVAALIPMFLILPSIVSESDLLTAWAILATASRIPAAIYQYRLIKRDVGLELDGVRIVKYVAAAVAVFGAVYIIQDEYLVDADIFEFLPVLFGYATVGIGGYFVITYAVDSEIRSLTSSIIKNIKERGRPHL